MAYKITERCVVCGGCEPMCPNEAIRMGETIFVIDSNKCTECVGYHESPMCAEICPIEAPIPDPEHQ